MTYDLVGNRTGLIASRFGSEGSANYDVLLDANADRVISSGDSGIYASEFGSCGSTGANTGNQRNWYNGDGLRVRARTFVSGRRDDDFVWDVGAGLPVILQDTLTPQSGSPTTTTYLYGLGLVLETVGSTSYFYLSDGLGSTTELTDTSASVQNSYQYDVWGSLRATSGSTANQFEFAGQQTDHNANRGLQYLRARYYDPSLGRFISRDPLPIGNRYAYVDNNVINYADPAGLCRFRCWAGRVGGAVGHGIEKVACDIPSVAAACAVVQASSSPTVRTTVELADIAPLAAIPGVNLLTTPESNLLDVTAALFGEVDIFESPCSWRKKFGLSITNGAHLVVGVGGTYISDAATVTGAGVPASVAIGVETSGVEGTLYWSNAKAIHKCEKRYG
jgi:RHS repeat-associated protein